MRLQARGPSASGRSGGGRPIPAGSSRSTGCTSAARCGGRAALRDPRRHRVRGGDARVRRPASSARLDRQEVRRRVHRAAPTRVGAQRRDVAGRRTASWCSSVVCTAWHRRPVRGRVEVPPRHRRVEGRAWSRSSTSCARAAARLLDVQWTTPHLASLGAVDVPRERYLESAVGATAMSTSDPARSPTSVPRASTASGSLPRHEQHDRRRCGVYHNPVCSKSRGALEILGERGVDVEVIEYLKAQPDARRPRAHRRRHPRPAGGAGAQGQAVRASSGSTPATTRPRSRWSRCSSSTPSSWSARWCSGASARVICRPSEKVLELLD